MGTPVFASPVMSALLDAGHEIVGVYTQPDRPSGRGKGTRPSGVKALAIEKGLPVFQPVSLRKDDGARSQLASLEPDLITVAAYGLYIPGDTLAAPRLGCLNVHPSLLPLYRGPSPVATAILAGDSATGVTIIRVTEEMDAGPIVTQRETRIESEETTSTLTNRLFEFGAALLVEILPSWSRGDIQPREQDVSKASVTRRLTKEDGLIDWSMPADGLVRRVRAFDPWPGSFTHWQGKLLKIADVSVSGPLGAVGPGEVIAVGDGAGAGTGKGVLSIGRLQVEGRRPVSAMEFLRGHQDFVGSILGEQPA